MLLLGLGTPEAVLREAGKAPGTLKSPSLHGVKIL